MGRTMKVRRKNCSLRPLIGCPFGFVFQLENGKDGPYLFCVKPEEVTYSQEKEDTTSEDIVKDNREIVDNNTTQSLNGEDIDAMRRYIAPEHVPVQYGGHSRTGKLEFSHEDSVIELDVKPNSKHQVELSHAEL
ncbi:hypothetical protein Droror1_Dr00002287 [Drosera rotundifolia]